MRLLELRPPKPGTRFVLHRDRLALFHETPDAKAYWSQYWLRDHAAKHLRNAMSGQLDAGFDVFFALLQRYVPDGARVLEGGCGPGHLVAALHARGYASVGVEYVADIVEFAKHEIPDLDVRLGDVEQLPFEAATFDCYASLGVIEHFEQGPAHAIAEAARILRPGGTAIFEVPYLNPLRGRHLRRLRGGAESPSAGLAFHQYYYDSSELSALFEQHGFTLLEQVPNCWESVVFREHAIVAPFWSSRWAVGPIRAPLRRMVRSMPRAGRYRYAHTMAFACRRR